MIGRTFAHYEIVDLLGRGGMGEVYRARDTRLEREVAIKILPAEVARDPERVARFQREAKVLAALNHPNVAGLHGFEEDGDVRFLVMELVEGEDLSERLRRGALSVDDTLDVARQMVEGLRAAHDRGIVHRDLKPANVKVTPEGVVKILDFGLATPMIPAEAASDPALSPTITAALTQAGTLLGTAAYMSPEQAAGRNCDQRADVWAWGVIVYELLTGKRLFGEDSPSETLAAVIRAEPDWNALPSGVPPTLRRVLEGCLRKKPGERWHAIADVGILLDRADDGASVDDVSRSSSWRPHPVWALLVIVGLAIGFALPRGGSPGHTTGTAAPGVVYGAIELPDGALLAGWSSPAVELSPDGRMLAFVADVDGMQRLFVRPLDQPDAIEVPDSDGAEGPFFSPDGRWIGFGAGSISGRALGPRMLKKYDLRNGVTTNVCGVGDYFGGTWRDDGTIFFVNVQPRGLWRVSAEGGEPSRVGGVQNEIRQSLAWPQMLPGGDRALVISWEGPDLGRVHQVDLETGESTDLGIAGAFARWIEQGYLFVADVERRVVAHRFDPEAAVLGTGSVQVLEDVTLTGNEAAVFAVSPTGDLVHSTGPVDGSREDFARAFWVSLDGTIEDVPLEPDYYSGMDVAPDGRRVALAVGARDLNVVDLERGSRLRLPPGGVLQKSAPLWTPTMDAIVFTGVGVGGDASLNLFVQPTDGVSPPVRLDRRAGEFFASSFEPDGRTFLHAGFETERDVRWKIYRGSVDRPDSFEVLLEAETRLTDPELSPGGNWLAYRSNETGAAEVFLLDYPGMRRKIPVGRGNWVDWSEDGRRILVLRRTAGRVTAVLSATFDPATGTPGALRPLLDFTALEHPGFDPRGALGVDYDHANDRFFVLQGIPGAGEIDALRYVRGWIAELRDMLPPREEG